MSGRLLGTFLLVVAVLGTSVVFIERLPPPTRAAELGKAFPGSGGSAFLLDPEERECLDPPTYIPDPFLRITSITDPDAAYDSALRALLTEQRNLRLAEERLFARTDEAASRETAVQVAKDRVEDAEEEARLFDTEANRTLVAQRHTALLVASAALERGRNDVEIAADSVDKARREVQRAKTAAASAATTRDEQHPDPRDPAYRGTLVRRHRLVLIFKETVSAIEIKNFLRSQRLEAKGGKAHLATFIVAINDDGSERTLEGDATRLRAIVDRLNEHEFVLSAVQDSLFMEHIITVKNTTDPGPRNWFGTEDPLVNSWFPEAWNYKDAFRARPQAAVLDSGFLEGLCKASGHCELDVQRLKNCGTAVRQHGTATAGVIGAGWNDGYLVDGAAPNALIYGCAPLPPKPCDEAGLTNFEIFVLRKGQKFSGYLTGLDILLRLVPATQPNVINASIGYNWGSVSTANADVQKLVTHQGLMIRALLRPYGKTVLVASAGNDSGKPAVWASAFNWAGLGGTVRSESPVGNVVVVQALRNDGVTPHPQSNAGGTISAIGLHVLTVVDGGTKYKPGLHEGTSAATPLVTAAVAMIQALDSSVDAATIKTALGSRNLNTVEAIKNADNNWKLHVADLVVDGRVDNADFLTFKEHFLAFEALPQGIFKHDLNEDGLKDRNDAKFCRIDLDGDGTVTMADLKVMQDAWGGTAQEAADLPRRLRE